MKLKNLLEFPKDVTEGSEIIRIHGNGECCIFNYDRILRCDHEVIRVLCKKRIVTVRGRKLSVPFYNKEQMMICGVLEEIWFERGGCD